MKNFFKLAALLALLALPSLAEAAGCATATRFWVSGGNGNWSSTTNWSAAPGGSSGATIPSTTDDVCFDATSGAVTSTMDQAFTIQSLDFGGASSNPFTGTWAQNVFTLTINGNLFRLVAGMTYNPGNVNRIISFTSTSGTTLITTAAKVLGSVVLGASGTGGTYQLQDDFNATGGGIALTLTAGTLDANNKNVTVGAFSSTGAGVTRRIDMGSGTWTMQWDRTTVWDLLNAAGNLTLNAGTSTLVFTGSANGVGRSANLGVSKSYNIITVTTTAYTATTSPVGLNLTTGVTIATLNISAGTQVNLSNAAALLTIGTLNLNGASASSTVWFFQSGTGTQTVAVTTANISWAGIGNLTFTGSPIANNSFNLGNNSGITINPPSGGGSRGIIGG